MRGKTFLITAGNIGLIVEVTSFIAIPRKGKQYWHIRVAQSYCWNYGNYEMSGILILVSLTGALQS